MTLTTRLSVFFLATLALVLTGFSGTLFLLAHIELHRHAAERLQSAAHTLAAVAEFERGRVEWDPAERNINLGSGPSGAEIVWFVRGDEGRILGRSEPPPDLGFLSEVNDQPWQGWTGNETAQWQSGQWLVSRQRLQSESNGDAPADSRTHAAVMIAVGVSLEPVESALRRLAITLVGTSLAVWLLALAVGRLVCRRALSPVSRMAEAARVMDGTDPSRRLPEPSSGDELEDLSRSFNGLLARLHESFERQQRFTGDASHQLRTPLTALLGHIEVALRRERAADEYRQTLASIHKQALHLHGIVEVLLFLARADAEACVPGTERFALDAWLEQHLRSWSEHPRAPDMILERADGTAEAQVPPALLAELVNILLENACKYSQPGSPITVRMSVEQEQVLLTVEDRGCGIPGTELGHIFEPFFRSADARRRGIAGLGLGLAIARRLTEAFGGRLTAASEVGSGSRFTVAFPGRPANAAGPKSLTQEARDNRGAVIAAASGEG